MGVLEGRIHLNIRHRVLNSQAYDSPILRLPNNSGCSDQRQLGGHPYTTHPQGLLARMALCSRCKFVPP